MDTIKLHDKFFKLTIAHQQIIDSIDRVAQDINRDYKTAEKPPVFLSVLTGSFMFCSELMKKIDFNCEIAFVKIKSYSGTSGGELTQLIGLTEDLRGRDVIIVEDIVESGRTINLINQLLIEAGAKSIRVATLFFKPEIYKFELPIDYPAMSIPNDFIVGFGLDYDGLGRNYKNIYSIIEQ